MHASATPLKRCQQLLPRWGFVCVWLLALSIVWQGSVIAMTRSAEPAHVHATADAEADRDPMLDGVRAVRNHHGASQHHHAVVERHAHHEASADVIFVKDDTEGADAVKNSNGKRPAAGLDGPVANLRLPPAALPFGSACPGPTCEYTSHIGARLERPPR